MHERFISEAIEPLVETSDTLRMAAGEPGLPRAFRWRGETLNITGVLRNWRTTGPCRHGSGERYVRKHWYEVASAGHGVLTIYFDRQPRRGRKEGRWWLFSMRDTELVAPTGKESAMVANSAVVGAGIMGVGIAQVLAMAGSRVRLHDASAEQLAKAGARLADNLQLLVEHGVIPAERARDVFARVTLEKTLAAAVTGAGFVIEAIPERLDLKLELYAELEERLAPEAIIASNTSTFPIAELSRQLVRPERFIIAHFFNPAELVPLVEIITMTQTAQSVVDATLELLRGAGKTPVLLKKDVPGFVANRLQAALLREALYLVQEGVVDPQDLDTVVSSGIGFRWAFLGPLEIADFGGLDTWKYVTENLFPVLDRSTTPSPALGERVARGDLGIKSGQGFYRYTPEEIRERLADRDSSFIGLLKAKELL